MELDINFSDFEKQFSKEEMRKKIKRSMEAMAIDWETNAKETVSDNAVDSGEFLTSIHYETFEEGDEIGFIGHDAVKYGIYHEFGTTRHWVPFYKYTGKVDGKSTYNTSEPILADWGKRVLGLSEEEMLARGGMNVQVKELMPFRKALAYVEAKANDIFKEEFKEV